MCEVIKMRATLGCGFVTELADASSEDTPGIILPLYARLLFMRVPYSGFSDNLVSPSTGIETV